MPTISHSAARLSLISNAADGEAVRLAEEPYAAVATAEALAPAVWGIVLRTTQVVADWAATGQRTIAAVQVPGSMHF